VKPRSVWSRAVALVALCGAIGGCVATDRIFAGRRDYALYREYRLADDLLERLKTGNRYLKELPDGRFRAEVVGWFEKSEREYYHRAHNHPSMLRAYLAALPDGPHAEQVIDRLIELDMLREYRDREARRREQKISRVTDQLESARVGREQVVSTLGKWTHDLSLVERFGVPTEELPHELLFSLRLSEPRMQCSGDRCTKTVRVAYGVPGKERLLPREAVFQVELALDRGLVRSVTLAGPELFNRLAEALSLVPVEPNDFSARIDAIARSVGLIENVLEARLPKASCEREVVAPIVLARACGGTHFELFAGDRPGALDGFSVRTPAPPRAAPASTPKPGPRP
jgi:hypothetical protein